MVSAALPIDASSFPNTYQGRLEVSALVRRLNSELLSHDSATETLRRWCAARHLAPSPRIVARRIAAIDKPAGAGIRSILEADPTEPIIYRHVELACGGRILSSADNWYRANQLTDAMNKQLAETTTPFGLVVRPLGLHRRTLEDSVLFNPLAGVGPSGTRRSERRDALPLPAEILRLRAVLETSNGTPISLVVETYRRAALAAPAARAARRPSVGARPTPWTLAFRRVQRESWPILSA
jgi:hypothetical protein